MPWPDPTAHIQVLASLRIRHHSTFTGFGSPLEQRRRNEFICGPRVNNQFENYLLANPAACKNIVAFALRDEIKVNKKTPDRFRAILRNEQVRLGRFYHQFFTNKARLVILDCNLVGHGNSPKGNTFSLAPSAFNLSVARKGPGITAPFDHNGFSSGK